MPSAGLAIALPAARSFTHAETVRAHTFYHVCKGFPSHTAKLRDYFTTNIPTTVASKLQVRTGALVLVLFKPIGKTRSLL